MIPQQEILLLAMKAGQIQLENGAEIFRVEDTIMHICRSYGLHSVNTFVLSNGIFISCGDEQEPQFAKVLQVPVSLFFEGINVKTGRSSVKIISGKEEAVYCPPDKFMPLQVQRKKP